MPTVFVSYSHDSAGHKAEVLGMVMRLRAAGLDVVFDQDMIPLGGPAEGWPQWSEAQVRNAGRVLIVCTENYRRRYESAAPPGEGLGSVYEGGIINQLLYNAGGVSAKFRAVLLNAQDREHVPLQLQRYHRYDLSDHSAYDEMLLWLKGGIPAAASKLSAVAWPAPSTGFTWSLADRIDVFQAFEKIVTGTERRRVLLISGSSNNGKTALNSELLAYCRHLGVSSALIDFKGSTSLDELFESMRLDLGPDILRQSYHATGNSRFLNLIADFQQLSTPLVLIFDTYEHSTQDAQRWLESQFLLRLDRAPALVAVIGGQKVPDHKRHAWGPLCQTLELQPIVEARYWLDYLERRWQFRPPLETVEAFTTATDGNPGQLSALFETLVARNRKKAGA